MAKAKTDLENYLVYGVDEKNRKIYFGRDLLHSEDEASDFTHVSTEYCIRAIERMATDHPKTPIELHMNSYGGDCYALLALYDVIHSISCQIKFYGKGAIMSAATFIMCGADERILYPNTTVMVHEAWVYGIEDRLTNRKIDTEEATRLMDKLYQIYADNSRMPKEFWEKICKRDAYLTAEEAVLLGLADKITQPKKRGNLRKSRQHHLNQTIDKRKMTRLVNKLVKRTYGDGKMEITINTPKPEPIDEKLTIEPMPIETEEKKEKE